MSELKNKMPFVTKVFIFVAVLELFNIGSNLGVFLDGVSQIELFDFVITPVLTCLFWPVAIGGVQYLFLRTKLSKEDLYRKSYFNHLRIYIILSVVIILAPIILIFLFKLIHLIALYFGSEGLTEADITNF